MQCAFIHTLLYVQLGRDGMRMDLVSFSPNAIRPAFPGLPLRMFRSPNRPQTAIFSRKRQGTLSENTFPGRRLVQWPLQNPVLPPPAVWSIQLHYQRL